MEGLASAVGQYDGSDSDEQAGLEDTWLDDEVSRGLSVGVGGYRRRSEPGVVEDVIARKGMHGRFAERWLSSRGLGLGRRLNSNAGVSHGSDALAAPAIGVGHQRSFSAATSRANVETRSSLWKSSVECATTFQDAEQDKDGSEEDIIGTSLKPKILQTITSLFASKTFFFSYDFDVTRSLTSQCPIAHAAPLHVQAEPQVSARLLAQEPSRSLTLLVAKYFWNSQLLAPFLDPAMLEYALPVMQGFIGQTKLCIPPLPSPPTNPSTSSEQMIPKPLDAHAKEYLLTLVSRISIRRAGLRYLCRGIDPTGAVANSVETEQILSSPSFSSQVHTHLQTRGSLPLYFTQVPTHSQPFKPLPQIHGSFETTFHAASKHFNELIDQYGGDVQIVSLLDRGGAEQEVGERYLELANHFNALSNGKRENNTAGKIHFEWFDFHQACQNMNFSNISRLMPTLSPFLSRCAWNVLERREHGRLSPPQFKIIQLQSGVVRTNCLDCLDRTNIAQAALARTVLGRQVQHLNPSLDPERITSHLHSAGFNALWAANGNALSQSYAGTPALKSAYLNPLPYPLNFLSDLRCTLRRAARQFWADDFTQVVLDYCLGRVGGEAWGEWVRKRGLVGGMGFYERMGDVGLVDFWADAARRGLSKVTDVIDEGVVAAWLLCDLNRDEVGQEQIQSPAPGYVADALVLVEKALHVVPYDLSAEKVVGDSPCLSVGSAEPLESIQHIRWGSHKPPASHTSESDRQYALQITYKPTSASPDPRVLTLGSLALTSPTSKSAFSAMPEGNTTNGGSIKEIASQIARQISVATPTVAVPVEEGDIIVPDRRCGVTWLGEFQERLGGLIWD